MKELVTTPEPILKPKSNRGWFASGDCRINREGRPRGTSKCKPEEIHDRLDYADRVKRLFFPMSELRACICRVESPGVINLPSGFEVIGCRFDACRNGVYFIIRCEAFPRIARGTAIPDFDPVWNGLKYCFRG